MGMEIQTNKGTICLARELFWDIPESNINATVAQSPEWVVPRVLEYGTLEEIRAIIELYGASKAIEIVKSVQLKPMARSMAYLFLDIELPKLEQRPLFYK